MPESVAFNWVTFDVVITQFSQQLTNRHQPPKNTLHRDWERLAGMNRDGIIIFLSNYAPTR